VKVKAPPFYHLPFDVCQDFVVDCSALAAASSLPRPNYHQSQQRIKMTPYDPEMVSSRLHALLESAREANNTDANRIPLRDFLARLQNEAEATEGYKLRQTQVCICKLQ
jgi:pyruvate/2-oxoglutarate dehydrogenase complex dihydrolipoamide acyltransferase (E2) component